MRTKSAALLVLFLPAACAIAPPTGPSVLAVPGANKDLATFQQDEVTCQNYAQGRIGSQVPGEVAGHSILGGAVAGTLLGAAAGAAIGAATGNVGAGAAIGGGSGLLLGSSIGANNGSYASGDLQRQYDFGYIQCMTAKGDIVQTAAQVPTWQPTYGYSSDYYYPYPYEPEPVTIPYGYGYVPHGYGYAPPLVATFGFGGGYGGGDYYRGGGHYWHGGPGWRGRR